MNWDELIQIIGDNTETPEQLKAIRDAALAKAGKLEYACPMRYR